MSRLDIGEKFLDECISDYEFFRPLSKGKWFPWQLRIMLGWMGGGFGERRSQESVDAANLAFKKAKHAFQSKLSYGEDWAEKTITRRTPKQMNDA